MLVLKCRPRFHWSKLQHKHKHKHKHKMNELVHFSRAYAYAYVDPVSLAYTHVLGCLCLCLCLCASENQALEIGAARRGFTCRNRNRIATTIFVFKQMPYPVWFLWPPKSYLLLCVHSLRVPPFRESSFNMTRGGWRYWGGALKIFRHPKGGLWKNCCARRGGFENLYTSKSTHDIIIQIGWFSTRQFLNWPVQLSYITWFTDITKLM